MLKVALTLVVVFANWISFSCAGGTSYYYVTTTELTDSSCNTYVGYSIQIEAACVITDACQNIGTGRYFQRDCGVVGVDPSPFDSTESGGLVAFKLFNDSACTVPLQSYFAPPGSCIYNDGDTSFRLESDCYQYYNLSIAVDNSCGSIVRTITVNVANECQSVNGGIYAKAYCNGIPVALPPMMPPIAEPVSTAPTVASTPVAGPTVVPLTQTPTAVPVSTPVKKTSAAYAVVINTVLACIIGVSSLM